MRAGESLIVMQYLNGIQTSWHQGADILQLGQEESTSSASRTAEEAIAHLQPPTLPEYLRGDDGDGPSGSEEDTEAKRLRSSSTTPRSAKGTDPDDYDHVMGIPRRNPQKWTGLVMGV